MVGDGTSCACGRCVGVSVCRLWTEGGRGGGNLLYGDGMRLEGNTLYVVLDLANTVAVVRLNATGTAGRIVLP